MNDQNFKLDNKECDKIKENENLKNNLNIDNFNQNLYKSSSLKENIKINLIKNDSFKCPKLPDKTDNLENEMQLLSLKNSQSYKLKENCEILKRPSSFKNIRINRKNRYGKSKFISITTLFIIGNIEKCNNLIKECLRIWVDGGMDKFKIEYLNIDFKNFQDIIIKKINYYQSCNCIAFLMDNFNGPIFDFLINYRQVIIGPTFITEYLTENGVTPIKLNGCRPTYCSSMVMITIFFSGFSDNDSDYINQISKKITYMGGHINNTFDNSTITHLICNNVLSDYYQEAFDMHITVVSKDWIEYCWENRNELDFVASMDTIENFEMKPFQGLYIKFIGFTLNEISQFEIIAHDNGAFICNELNNKITHIVCENKERFLNETNIKLLSENINIMTTNWFWKCIQMDRYFPDEYINNITTSRCDDSMPFDLTDSIISTSILNDNQNIKTNINTYNENDQIENDLTNLNDNEPISIGSISLKKQSTITEECKPTSSNIYLKTNKSQSIITDKIKSENLIEYRQPLNDMTLIGNNKQNYSPNKLLIKPKIFNENVSEELIQKKSSLVRLASISAHSQNIQIDPDILKEREHIVDEFLQTEANYVKILKTIIELFYIPLEKLIKSSTKPFISMKDVKFIFAAFPQILSIHSSFLNDLIFTKKSMTFKHICVGTLLLGHIEKYPKAYSPYVNYYDLIYTSIRQWDETNPRFHAFLKGCETDSRCNRETLHELIIRPIQRLPSTLILLEKIVKFVNPAEPDYKCLTKSIQILKGITLTLNEGKRVLESKMRVFSIINNVEKCPPGIVSFGRDLELKFDAIEKTNSKMFSKNGRCLVVYLLTDGIEIASKKLLKIISKSVMNSAKNILSPSINQNSDSTFYIDDVNNIKSDKDKSFKHFLYLDIKNIYSIYNVIPNKFKDNDSSSDIHKTLNFSNSNMNNIVGLLYYVDQYHYNFLYFKIQGKNANNDKENFIKKLAMKIAHYRKLDSYTQVIVETSQIISRKDDLMCINDEASTSDITINDDTHVSNSNVSIVNVQSPFQGRSNLMKLQELTSGSNHSVMSATMMKLKKAKKGAKLSFIGQNSKSKPLERSCSITGTSKYSKKTPVDAQSFCGSQTGTGSQSINDYTIDEKFHNVENKKKRESISVVSSSRFSFSLSSWKRNSTCSSSISKKEAKQCKDGKISKTKKSKKSEISQNTTDNILPGRSSVFIDHSGGGNDETKTNTSCKDSCKEPGHGNV